MDIRGRHDVEKVASELAIELFLLKTEGHWLALNRNKTSFDPDILYLYAPGGPFHLEHRDFAADAYVIYRGSGKSINWNYMTKAALRKWILAERNDSECIVCYEPQSNERHLLGCQQCSAMICGDCSVQLGMTPEFQDGFNSTNTDRRFSMRIECPECRHKSAIDIRAVYHGIHLDRHENFSENIQRILRSLKDNDSIFEKRFRHRPGKSKEKMKCFEKGCKVILQGLKKEEWNGQKAVITGERDIQNGPIRWPIQLLNGKKE